MWMTLRGVDVMEEDLCLCSQFSLSTAPLWNQLDQFGQSSVTINHDVTEIFYSTLFHSCFIRKVKIVMESLFQHLKQDITHQGANFYCCHQGAGVKAANPPQGLKAVKVLSSLGHAVTASSLSSSLFVSPDLKWQSNDLGLKKVFSAEEKHDN